MNFLLSFNFVDHEINEDCSDKDPCAPGLKCEADKCTLDKEQCSYTKHLGEALENMMWIPRCLPDDTYAPVQCKGDKATYGRCYCTSPTGKRIFGWMWYKDADKMTCACSRKRDELEKTRDDVTLHCAPDGSFEELQCDRGVCWCAEKDTGEPKIGLPIVPETMIKRLPCYNVTAIGEQYLRQCESQRYAMAQIRALLSIRGTQEASLLSVFCDYDGSYGPVQLKKGVVFCSGKDKTPINGWMAESGVSVNAIDCNCARDSSTYTENNLEFNMVCEANGNYRLQQEHDAKLYCVDRDGHAITKLQDKGVTVNCTEEIQNYP